MRVVEHGGEAKLEIEFRGPIVKGENVDGVNADEGGGGGDFAEGFDEERFAEALALGLQIDGEPSEVGGGDGVFGELFAGVVGDRVELDRAGGDGEVALYAEIVWKYGNEGAAEAGAVVA